MNWKVSWEVTVSVILKNTHNFRGFLLLFSFINYVMNFTRARLSWTCSKNRAQASSWFSSNSELHAEYNVRYRWMDIIYGTKWCDSRKNGCLCYNIAYLDINVWFSEVCESTQCVSISSRKPLKLYLPKGKRKKISCVEEFSKNKSV